MLIAHMIDNGQVEAELPITDLVEFYKQSKVKFDADPEFKKRA